MPLKGINLKSDLAFEIEERQRHFATCVVAINPAFQTFLDSLGTCRAWGQLSIEQHQGRFRIRHANDTGATFDTLRRVSLGELRGIVNCNSNGQFRPLRLAPDLQRGWLFECNTADELRRALQEVYPGSIADWFAAREGPPPVTNYREFTNRQTGMYRITQLLSDGQAAQVIRACCAPEFCLKRRFWSVEGLTPDNSATKSDIPCLEPCAVLLELARKAARIEQEEKANVQLSRSDLESLVAAAKTMLESGRAGERVGNIASPTNPRRLRLVLEKIGGAVDASPDPVED